MSVVAPAPVAPDDPGELLVAGLRGEAFVDGLVTRLHEEYGADPESLRIEAAAALAVFASARVRAFVPILVEKRLRAACRGRRAARP